MSITSESKPLLGVLKAGGAYVLVAKDNQPALAIDIEGGFAFATAARSIAAATSP